MSKQIITSNRIIKTKEIVNKSDSSNKWMVESNSSKKGITEKNIKSQLKCTCKNIKRKKLNLNQVSDITDSFEEKNIRSLVSENMKTINTTISNVSLQVQTTDIESKEKIDISKEILEELQIKWDCELFIQIIERLQYLAAEPPKLYAQFPDDMMIHRTINNAPIRILIPIPDYYVQQQDHFEVLSKSICKFGYLEKEQLEILIDNKKKLEQEKHNLTINPSQRMWKGPVMPVKTNKIGIEEEANNWKDLVKVDSVNSLEFIQLKEEKENIKEKPQYSLSEETNITVGGKGFNRRIWSPIPDSNGSFTIEKEIISEPYSEESVIINDDYNKIKNLKIRPILVSILKFNDEEESSVESLDIWQEIVIKKINLNIEEENNLIRNRFKYFENNRSGKKYKINFYSNNKNFNRVCK